MARYRLAARALKDVAEIVTYLHRVQGSSVADRAETRMFGAFDDLGSGRSRVIGGAT